MSNSGLLLRFPLQNLNRMGLLRNKKVSKTTFLFTFLMVLVQFFYMEYGDVTSYVNNFEGVVGFLQITLKFCLLLYNKQKFLNLITVIKKFWTDDQCSTTTQKNVLMISKRVVILQKIFSYTIIFILVMITPYSIIHKILIIGDWQLEKNGMFILGWTAVFVTSATLACFVGFYDENLNVDGISSEQKFKSYYQKLQTYIKYHLFLLEFHNELQRVYSVSLLVQYLTSSPFLCMQLYAVTEAANLFWLIRYVTSICCLVFQIAFYCIAANYMEHEMSTISTAIYNSNWYSKHFLTARTPIILIIQRAQRRATLSACGLIEINIDALVKLLKLGFSVCIALKGLKNPNQK